MVLNVNCKKKVSHVLWFLIKTRHPSHVEWRFKTLCQHSLWWTTSKGLKYCFEPLVLCSGCDQEYGAHQRFPHSPGHHFVLKPLVAPHESNTWCSWWYSRKVLCGKPSSILEQRGYLCQRGVHMKYQATTTTPPSLCYMLPQRPVQLVAGEDNEARYSKWPAIEYQVCSFERCSWEPLNVGTTVASMT